MAFKTQVVADVKERAVCPACENDKWIIDRRTLEQGDEPTAPGADIPFTFEVETMKKEYFVEAKIGNAWYKQGQTSDGLGFLKTRDEALKLYSELKKLLPKSKIRMKRLDEIDIEVGNL